MAKQSTSPARESRRRDAESSREVSRLGDQFLASLNHDIRTPLSGIMGMTDLLLETNLSKEQQEYVTTTRLCAAQLLEMLNAALEYAALSAGNFRMETTEFHLRQSLEGIVAEYLDQADAKGLSLACRLDGNLPEYVVGDFVRLRQMLSPVIGNALKFTSQGEVEVNAVTRNGINGEVLLTVSVRDTGLGIPPEKQEMIFDSFRQLESGLSRTYAGMGLGLALARKLAGVMGGTISVDSEPEIGSTFHLSVPLALPQEPAAAPSSQREAATPGGGRRHRILLVDDNEVARRVVTHILGRANYDVRCAEGGQEGIQAASEHGYDLILMDLQMPNVDGLQATAAIRRLPGYTATPILALSANYSEEFEKSCLESGMQDFVSKPIQNEELLGTLERYLK